MAKKRTDNTMVKTKKGQTIKWQKKKDRQYNGQNKKGQTIQWSKKRTDNTMVKIKKDTQ
jgi:hypothetical protein